MRNHKRVHPTIQPQRPSKVQQSAAADADINNKVAKHMRGAGRFGAPLGDPNATRQPRFEAVSSQSYHDMLNQVADIQNHFRALPARVKSRFGNDPYQLMRWVQAPENRMEALKMGLLVPTDEEVMVLREHRTKEAMKARGHGQQLDLEQEAHKAGEAFKADPEANPSYPQKGGAKA